MLIKHIIGTKDLFIRFKTDEWASGLIKVIHLLASKLFTFLFILFLRSLVLMLQQVPFRDVKESNFIYLK